MEELKEILIQHALRYPRMEPKDAVKLIYQNTFGGGHMIRDVDSCLAYLLQEYESVSQNADLPLTEEIGNGFVRVHLQALDAHHYRPERLGTAFIQSASETHGTLAEFLPKLDLLRQLTEESKLPFSVPELDAYLKSYQDAGYPMVSHSDSYRQTYQPAYRIILRRFTESLL